MKVIQFKNKKNADMLTKDEFYEIYEEYLADEVYFDSFIAEMKCKEMEDPYIAEEIVQKYDGDYEIEGVLYEVRRCHTDFCRCGMFHMVGEKPFEFYMLIDKRTLPSKTVGSYIDAEKFYVVI